MIPVVLFARIARVAVPIPLLGRRGRFPPGSVAILTWGGLRGGIAVALALSTPAGPPRDAIVAMTTLWSGFAQGLTLERLAPSVADGSLF